MSNLSRLEAAQRELLTAVNRSQVAASCDNPAQRADAESEARRAAHDAELKLLNNGRRDLATRLEAVVTRDMTTTDARTELRQVAQKLDAELSPAVDATTAFRAASDGGVGDE